MKIEIPSNRRTKLRVPDMRLCCCAVEIGMTSGHDLLYQPRHLQLILRESDFAVFWLSGRPSPVKSAYRHVGFCMIPSYREARFTGLGGLAYMNTPLALS